MAKQSWCPCFKICAKPECFLVIFPLSILCLFLMAARHTKTSDNVPHSLQLSQSGEENDYAKQRSKIYEKMSRDLYEHGARFLSGGQTSQSLSLSELFDIKNGVVVPVLKPANPPVRANVLYLDPKYSQPIAHSVKQVFLPHFGNAIWFQDANMYHFSMYHASHHLEPVNATVDEVQVEINAIKEVAKTSCPLKIQLERILLTSTGVLIGCWQVIDGTDPAIIRRKLQHVLPQAPRKQLYNSVILHTSFARLLGYPRASDGPDKASSKVTNKSEDVITFIDHLVSQLNKKLQGYKALISELWFVEEYDVLALALNGRIKAHKFSLNCLTD